MQFFTKEEFNENHIPINRAEIDQMMDDLFKK